MKPYVAWREAPPARFAVIGDPISHSLSPRMQGAALRALGEEGEYLAVHVLPDELLEALDHLETLGYEGINVTVPHKAGVFPWLRQVEPFAERVGAVNTIHVRDRAGMNTDAPGFLTVLRDAGIVTGSPILILGAGGTTRSLLPALAEAGYPVSLWNRTTSRARELVDQVDGEVSLLEELSNPDHVRVVVNATSASLAGEGLDIVLRPGQLAIDLAYRVDGPTPFLLQAQKQGADTMDGRPLLAAQGALSLAWWLGRPVDPAPMRIALGLPG